MAAIRAPAAAILLPIGDRIMCGSKNALDRSVVVGFQGGQGPEAIERIMFRSIDEVSRIDLPLVDQFEADIPR